MKYNGRNNNLIKCSEFINKYCILERTPKDANNIEIFIYTKDKKEEVAEIQGYLYNYKREYVDDKRYNALHIKSLWTHKDFEKRGIATYLMKEIIKYAEYNRVKHITVHALAATYRISQEALERFYKNFLFNYKCIGLKREREIELKTILD